ncbi:MAG: hypothetical protein QW625_00710 [Candidatus Nanoarchaeia archaeon]
MFRGKYAYLSKLTENQKIISLNLDKIGTKLEGSSPPSVFIGSYNYPKVFVGPMLSPLESDTSTFDLPEIWILSNKTTREIMSFRLNLIRGKSLLSIYDLENKIVQKLQEMALAKHYVYSEAEFKTKPKGSVLSEEHLPFGPSAPIKKFEIENVKWQKDLEKVYYDKDLKAKDAIISLYSKNLFLSQIQKAFSVGVMGSKDNRKLVPTRWSITATENIIGDWLLEEIKQNQVIENYQVFEIKIHNNYFAILLMPTPWQYENFEAFIHILGDEVMFFSDWESFNGRKKYSEQGGCYYSVRLAIAEYLKRINRQAGAIVFREAYRGYIPLGVWMIREAVRCALKNTPKEFFNLKDALTYIKNNLFLPLDCFISKSILLNRATNQSNLLHWISN